MVDLDQSGQGFQSVVLDLGPTLGKVQTRVQPQRSITVAGTTTLDPGDSIALINIAGLVTINLPDVSLWVKQPHYAPATGFERALWVKDLGGNAVAFNITVHPFGVQTIDNLAIDYTIVQARQLLRLYPLNDLSGWFSG